VFFGALPFGHIVLHWSEGMCCITSFSLMPSISFFMAVSISCLEHSERDLLLVCSPLSELMQDTAYAHNGVDILLRLLVTSV